MGVRRVLTTVVALGAGVFLLGAGLSRLETRITGVPGQFRAERCEVSESKRGDDGVLCAGSFEADDRSFRIERLDVETTFDAKPAGPVPVTVDGPSATVAVDNEAGVWLYPGATGLVCLLVGAWNVRGALVRKRGGAVSAASGT
ncbi:hypothetical protein ABZ729_04190 [Streptomyces sp. NPDC006678]|uniref:hypothetical protein n=1 Tax=Streptomyces sp. NPDC006678 TaxID=3157185 RepID=UPI0033F817A8